MSAQKPSYADVVLSCLDRALNIVGEGGRKLVFEALENRYGVTREKVAEHPQYLLKIMKVYLGSASEAVEKEALYWIKQESGIEADGLLEAIEALKRDYGRESLRPPQEPPVPSVPKWKLESHTKLPELTKDGESELFQYSAKFSFGPPPAPKQSDPQSREALEAYLKEIVERHNHDKNKED